MPESKLPPRAAVARIQPHIAHIPGPDGNRREIDLGSEMAPSPASGWSELYEAHQPWMRAMVHARIPARLQARFDGEDVIQSAFLALWGQVDAAEASVEGDIRCFLVKVARNELRDEVRHHTRLRRSAHEECASSEGVLEDHACQRDLPHETIEKAELQAALMEALQQLNEVDRTLVHMRYVEQRSWVEIARTLDLPETTTRRKGLEAFGRLMRLVD